jgi:hypothetical protein
MPTPGHSEAHVFLVEALVDVWKTLKLPFGLSPPQAGLNAEAVIRIIVDPNFKPDKTFPELRELWSSHAAIDPLNALGETCRPNAGS